MPDPNFIIDPNFISTSVWHDVSDHLTWLILFAVFMIGFGVNLLLAHAVIPSLATTGHLPERLSQRVAQVRVALYGAAAGSIVVAALFMGLTIAASDLIARIYGRWWI